MTASKDTESYFLSKHIPCFATPRNSAHENGIQEHRNSHDQRFIVMDEPIPSENQTVMCHVFNIRTYQNIHDPKVMELLNLNLVCVQTIKQGTNLEHKPFVKGRSMLVAFVGIELENNQNETFYECRGYNCGISKFKGLPAMDVKRNFQERWQNLSNTKDVIMPELYFQR